MERGCGLDWDTYFEPLTLKQFPASTVMRRACCILWHQSLSASSRTSIEATRPWSTGRATLSTRSTELDEHLAILSPRDTYSKRTIRPRIKLKYAHSQRLGRVNKTNLETRSWLLFYMLRCRQTYPSAVAWKYRYAQTLCPIAIV